MAATKPSMFIGSSVEGKRIAETIQLALEYEVHSTIWHQGVFGLSGGTLESLVAALNDYDFATLVLTADDLLEKRNVTGRSPRDNVLFELGLFMGALGRARTFIVHSRTNPPVLPSDLAGITPATYEDRDNLDAALGPVCTKIRRAIESQGARQKAPDAEVKDASDPRISTLHQMLTEQNLMLTKLFQLTATQSKIHADPADSLDFLGGAWISSHNNHAYCKMIHGRPYFVYCWGGDSDATGEYYEFRRIDNDIVGRFRWFEGGIRGFVWLKIEHVDLLTGAWWMERDVPGLAYNDPELLKKAKGMNSYSWTRKATAAFPAWATAVFDRVK